MASTNGMATLTPSSKATCDKSLKNAQKRWHWYGRSAKACVLAAACGRLEVLQWLCGWCPCDITVSEAAAQNGRLEVLKWLCREGHPWNAARVWIAAAENGRLEVLQWLHANNCTTEWEASCHGAAAKGHLEVLKWLHKSGCPKAAFTRASEEAARHGRLKVLKWLHAIRFGSPWADSVCAAAARAQ